MNKFYFILVFGAILITSCKKSGVKTTSLISLNIN